MKRYKRDFYGDRKIDGGKLVGVIAFLVGVSLLSDDARIIGAAFILIAAFAAGGGLFNREDV